MTQFWISNCEDDFPQAKTFLPPTKKFLQTFMLLFPLTPTIKACTEIDNDMSEGAGIYEAIHVHKEQTWLQYQPFINDSIKHHKTDKICTTLNSSNSTTVGCRHYLFQRTIVCLEAKLLHSFHHRNEKCQRLPLPSSCCSHHIPESHNIREIRADALHKWISDSCKKSKINYLGNNTSNVNCYV